MNRLLKKIMSCLEPNSHQTEDRYHSLTRAIQNNDLFNARKLLSKIKEPPSRQNPYSSLLRYVETTEMLDLLINFGADVNAKQIRGRNTISFAIQKNNIKLLIKLFEHGAVVNTEAEENKEVFTTLQWPISHAISASEQKSVCALFEILLHHGAKINAQNIHGQSALHEATQRNRNVLVQYLIAHGANPCLKDKGGNSAFDYTNKKEILDLFEPYKHLLEPKIKDNPTNLIQRIVAIKEASFNDFTGLTNEEISEIEKSCNFHFPKSYKLFLSHMGKGAGSFLLSDHWDAYWTENYNQTLGLTKISDEQKVIVIASRMGDFSLCYKSTQELDDETVYGLNYDGQIKKAYEDFWAFIQEMVEYYEFYKDSSKIFSQIDKDD